MVERIDLSRKQEQGTLETVKILNKKFCVGESPWKEKTLSDIKSLPNPIVLDFNGVLVNHHRPWVPNPKAENFLSSLVKLGTVFIVTNAYGDWDLRQQALGKFGLWHEGMVMMTFQNHNLIRQTPKEHKQRIQAIEDFIKLRNLSPANWDKDLGKRIAPLFMKTLDVPIIDDYSLATLNNPGMLGIKVQSFPLDPFDEDQGLPLEKALEIVERHYKSNKKL